MDLHNLNSYRNQRAIELKRMRKDAGLTQEKLWLISGIAQATIRRIESGSFAWNIDTEILIKNAIVKYSQENGL